MPVHGLDHIVLGVRDLDAAGRFYERLGFTVGQRNQHPWGTDNRIVQMPGFFLELITVARPALIAPHRPRQFSFGQHVASALRRGQGPSMLVLETRDAHADAARFAAAGIGDFEPFHFARKGRTAEGQEIEVAFTLAFARDPMARRCGFFTCQQHRPALFWNKAAQAHANGVTGVGAVYLVAENPTDHHIFLSAFTGQRALTASSSGIVAPLPRGRIEILTAAAAARHLGRPMQREVPTTLVGLSFQVRDLAALAQRLRAGSVAHRWNEGRLIVSSRTALGTTLVFEQGPAAA